MVEQATAIDAAKLAAGFRGRLVGPDDGEYDDVRRVWNGAIDRRPGLIAQCTGAADVASAVRFARVGELAVAVRGGGHSLPGYSTCDEGLVIDLSPMQGVWIDPGTRVARAQGGVTWSLFDHEAQAFGLGVTGGQITHTGIAGLTLGGGIGWLMRKHGLTCDNLVSADVVTADGEILRASENEHQELFWGLRGGGGNFGIVTSLEYRLHPVGIILGGLALYPMDRAPELLRVFRDFTDEAPDEVTAYAVFLTAPPFPFIPEEAHGQPVFGFGACYAGPVDEGERVLRPLREADPIVDLFQPMPYTVMQAMLDPAAPPGDSYYVSSAYLGELTDEALDVILEAGAGRPCPLCEVHVAHMGGAVARVPVDATAFGHRDAQFTAYVIGHWQDPAASAAHVEWAHGYRGAIAPYATGAYVNFLQDEGEEGIRFAYGAETYERLAELKRRYDPTNFFQLNQNVATPV